ncbi:MAG: DUF554 domain-containing protein [Firmicutes bacterium]|nr:DUF554 domain-containing protein [Bacillota bacterium]
MTGTLVNVAAIAAGSFLGVVARKGIPSGVRDTVMQGVGLAVLLIGFKMAWETRNPLIVVGSLALGGAAGELLALEERLDRAGRWLEARVAGAGTGEVARAFVTATLVFCVGAMAIMGAIEDGLGGVPHILYTKAILDGVTSVVFGSALGIGVLFSALPVLVYQGGLTLAARVVGGILTPPVVAELTAAGGLIIVGIGINLLGLARIRTGNLLPAIVFAALIALAAERW